MPSKENKTLVATVLANGSCFVQRPGKTGRSIRSRTLGQVTAFDAAMEDIGLAIDHMVIAGRDWADRGPDERQRALNRLRDAGYDLLTILAHEKDRDGFVKELLKTDYVQAGGERNVPWEFLYLGSREEPAVLQNFLGAHAAVGFPGDRQDVPGWLGQTTSLRSDNRYAIRPPGQPLISGLAEDHTLDSAMTKAEAMVLAKWGLSPITLKPLRGARVGALDAFSAFLSDAIDLVHFNCHAQAGGRNKPSQITLTDEFPIKETEIVGLAIEIDAIVVLNCCHGIALRRDTRDTVATAFADRGVRAIIGPTNEVADDFATLWADHFYAALVDGEAVGQAVLSARQSLFALPNANPLALLYAFIGEHDARLAQELAA